jgi:hypothetical protein
MFKNLERTTDQGNDKLHYACSILEQYHIETKDLVTRFGGEVTDIYIVKDPEWKEWIKSCMSVKGVKSE